MAKCDTQHLNPTGCSLKPQKKFKEYFFISFNSKNFRHVVFKNNETTKSQLLYLRIKRWSVT